MLFDHRRKFFYLTDLFGRQWAIILLILWKYLDGKFTQGHVDGPGFINTQVFSQLPGCFAGYAAGAVCGAVAKRDLMLLSVGRHAEFSEEGYLKDIHHIKPCQALPAVVGANSFMR